MSDKEKDPKEFNPHKPEDPGKPVQPLDEPIPGETPGPPKDPPPDPPDDGGGG